MLAIITALRAEADPLIDHFSLRRDMARHAIELFRSSEIVLAVSGIGRVRSAMTVGALCGSEGGIEAILNVGIAGCRDCADLGGIFLINQVRGPAGSRPFLPDMILNLPCTERALRTVDTPMWSADPTLLPNELVDMEGSGIGEAASQYLAPSRIQLLKVASDNLERTTFTRSSIAGLIGSHLGTIETCLFTLAHLTNASTSSLSPDDTSILTEVAARCSLTYQQRKILWDLATNHRVQAPRSSLEFLLTLAPSAVHSKRETRDVFNQLRRSFERPSL
ncbi:MAG: hypothetical protein QY326_04650 [Bdellovibrionota bacterium]|nr:MAG: hypothetical protein QY326_04650 [Bdellovibrionota bacterium]